MMSIISLALSTVAVATTVVNTVQTCFDLQTDDQQHQIQQLQWSRSNEQQSEIQPPQSVSQSSGTLNSDGNTICYC